MAKGPYVFQGKGLTIAQPWASAIAFAGKDIENRPWRTHYRGPIANHASQTIYTDELDYKRRVVRGGPRRTLLDWINGSANDAG